jgi:hypothetical protein
MSRYKLTEEIIALSEAKIWDAAKHEWVLHEIYEAEEPETCLCGHFPIIEVCTLQNKLNANFATVGNCCVKKFIGLPSDLIFQAVKRVRKDSQKALNAAAIQHAHDKGWINDWEYTFSLDTMKKRNLSHSQMTKREQINQKMINRMNRSKLSQMPEKYQGNQNQS